MKKTMSSLRPGETAVVAALTTRGPLRRRLLDLGFVPGAAVRCRLLGIGGKTAAYLVHDTVIALRRWDAETIFVE